MSTHRYVALLILPLMALTLLSCATPRKAGPAAFEVSQKALREAKQKLDQKEFSAAADLFQEYLATYPDSAEALNGLGLAQMETGELDAAIDSFQAVLKTKPNQPYATLYLGLSYLKKELFSEAIDMWQGYRNPDTPELELEIKRQLTLLLVAQSQRDAQRMIAMEQQLLGTDPDPNTIGVSYFKDLSTDASLIPFQKALAAMISTTLTKVSALKVVERLRLQSLLEEMALGQSGIVEEGSAPRVGKLLGAERMITGSLAVGSIEVTTSVLSTSRGEVEGTKSQSIERENFFNAPGIVVMDVAEMAGLELTPAEVEAIGVPITTNVDAMQSFGMAIGAMDAGDWQGAQEFTAAAIAADPGFSSAVQMMDSIPPPEAPNVAEIRDMAPAAFARVVAEPIQQVIEALEPVLIEEQMKLGDEPEKPVEEPVRDQRVELIEAWEEAIIPSTSASSDSETADVTPIIDPSDTTSGPSTTNVATTVSEDNSSSSSSDELPGFPTTP